MTSAARVIGPDFTAIVGDITLREYRRYPRIRTALQDTGFPEDQINRLIELLEQLGLMVANQEGRQKNGSYVVSVDKAIHDLVTVVMPGNQRATAGTLHCQIEEYFIPPDYKLVYDSQRGGCTLSAWPVT